VQVCCTLDDSVAVCERVYVCMLNLSASLSVMLWMTILVLVSVCGYACVCLFTRV